MNVKELIKELQKLPQDMDVRYSVEKRERPAHSLRHQQGRSVRERVGNSQIPRPMNRKERQEAWAERYREYAENATKRATAAFNASNDAVADIPLGQPILVGHHSEKAHRRALELSNNAMMRSVHESEKAAYYAQKAEAVENNDNIYIGDDDAIERLKKKISELTALQELMKGANKIIRAKSLSDIEKIDALVNLGISRPKANKMVGAQIIFPGYALTNNNAKISAAKKQLAKAEALASKEDREYTIDDITIEECYSENRVRIYFPGKPDDDMRANLKRNGFRWAPSMGCWQAYINRWTLRFVNEINKSNQ